MRIGMRGSLPGLLVAVTLAGCAFTWPTHPPGNPPDSPRKTSPQSPVSFCLPGELCKMGQMCKRGSPCTPGSPPVPAPPPPEAPPSVPQ